MAVDTVLSARAMETHQDAIVFDGHYDRLYSTPELAYDDLPKLRAGGVTVHVRQSYVGDVLPFFERTYETVERWPGEVSVAIRAADIRSAKREGKIATVLSIEGAEPLQGDLTLLRLLYRLGLRNLGIAWSTRNEAADGVFERRTGGGLTKFGVKLVTEARRLGIMVDIAHLAPAGVKDVFDIYDGPVIASHANAQALCGHCRNLSDDQIERVAASGGLIGVTLVPEFLASERAAASLETVISHMDHIVSVAGIDHVGIGTDWEGFELPAGYFMQDIADLPLITQGLLERGYSRDDIHKILGGNFLRAFEEVVG
jgi:membrane dipeptidase